MKAEINILDSQDFENRIAQKVINVLKPLLAKGKTDDDSILTVKTLAKYLEVSDKWIYERVQFKEIPFYKINGLLRFGKNDIDTWLATFKTPTVNTPSILLKAVK